MNSKLITYIVVAVVAAAAGVGGTYAVQNRKTSSLKARVERLDAQRRALETSLDAAETSLAAQPSSPSAEDPAEHPAEESKKVTSTKEFSFIRDVKFAKSGKALGTITADYAQFLTGAAAAKAAAAAGDESPPPNDYYIVNANPKLRTLNVSAGVRLKLTTNPDGTADPAGYASDFESWANYFAAPSEENAPIRAAGYWLTLEDGVVVAIEEQFVP